MDTLVQALMGLALIGLFAHAVYAIVRGRVYCKGSWYNRGESAWFWPLVVLYLFGAPTIAHLAFSTT